jgi:hypothetical protein
VSASWLPGEQAIIVVSAAKAKTWMRGGEFDMPS